MTGWTKGDTGLTANGFPYRVLCVDFDGAVGPLVVAVRRDKFETLVQLPADGVHPGGLKYLDLKPPKVRA
ncbi:hypothetical protein [Reyranella sp.]|jgi:hypothetical protein|uniref:hypothetical protein n=1 Tax=Reyranella sp. TaxID=1929291 RepID=UPI000BD169EB|nr:hypothetical protein [Reyranella sp.]OYY35601.1 MAG: hypothetical protein B7Y57_25820 [Rhodospirillales bacterium 35-66-84]OYZ91471.1 MAG: hypothetical protein B7Y08_25690 [Rhodospirillales bacterium 24-66-33]OZB22008.1 MAG: hypothetical protein B7X63_24615 [Rhodospirillales bacterium 39-66-50]HQS14973.1 hypothetical protein [Reyranella sp.]HQT10782.1 hypothetical protein [Reyranella sp.]